MPHPMRTPAVAAVLLLSVALIGVSSQRSPAGDLAVPVAPVRRPAADAPVAPPPPLPAAADRVPSLTLQTRVRKHAGGRVHEVQQTITRTADRIHVSARGGGEWLFERNPRDPRRVSGHFIDHAAKTIVYYSDSDLRNVLGIPGWAHVLTLGFDHQTLASLEPSTGVRVVGPLSFTGHVARGGGRRAEVWWNTEAALPAEVSMAEGTSRLVVEQVTATVDARLLQPPGVRYPAYRQVELAD